MRTGRVIGLLVLLFCITTWITMSDAQEQRETPKSGVLDLHPA